MNAVARLEASRARLLHAMMPPPAVQGGRPAVGLLGWLERIKRQPSMAVILDTLESWWTRHPVRPLVDVASEAANAVVKPIAQHNPFVLVLTAGALGAAFVWSRPWRWALKPALFAGLMPQLVSRVIGNLPLESWLAAFGYPMPGTRSPAKPQRNSP